jgi:hypothetical protein
VRIWNAVEGGLINSDSHSIDIPLGMLLGNFTLFYLLTNTSFNCLDCVGFCWDKKKHSLKNTHMLFSNTFLNSTDRLSSYFDVSEDGWIVFAGPEEFLICWLPHDLHMQLYHPQNKLVIGQNPVQFDLSSLPHGPEWIKCYQSSEVYTW